MTLHFLFFLSSLGPFCSAGNVWIFPFADLVALFFNVFVQVLLFVARPVVSLGKFPLAANICPLLEASFKDRKDSWAPLGRGEDSHSIKMFCIPILGAKKGEAYIAYCTCLERFSWWVGEWHCWFGSSPTGCRMRVELS